MTIHDILLPIEVFAAPALQEDWDNAGLITGQRHWPCTGALLCLDTTPEVVAEAASRGCNLIIAHHPIVFKGIKKLNGTTYFEQAIIEAIKKDIAIYAAHTNLDNIVGGVSGKMAQRIGLKACKVLSPKSGLVRRLITFAPKEAAKKVADALFAAGAGQIGKYDECSFSSEGMGTFRAGEGANPYVGEIGERHSEPEVKIETIYPFYLEPKVLQALQAAHPYEEAAYDVLTLSNIHSGIGAGIIGELEMPEEEAHFLQRIKTVFNTGCVRHTALRGRPIKKVAVCGGAGAFLIKTALAQSADCYITADIKYHEFFDAEGAMVLADIGHYESEIATIELLHDLLVEKIPNFAPLKTSVDTNPVRYLG